MSTTNLHFTKTIYSNYMSESPLIQWLRKHWNKFDEKMGERTSQKQYAEHLGVGKNYLSMLIAGKRENISLEMTASMANATGDNEIYDIAGFSTFKPKKMFYSIPVLGRIEAGMPLPLPPSDLNYFSPDQSIELAASFVENIGNNVSDLFALEVQGSSMVDALINDGDIIVLRAASTAENGDMVAVYIDGEDGVTLKYFYRENGKVRLQPANPQFEPIFIDADQVRIQGKVVMVIREVHGSLA